MFFTETVKIKDSTGLVASFEISTPTKTRLNFELHRSGYGKWRPHFWGGDWTVKDLSFIRYGSGKVWYSRALGDSLGGDVCHLDIFLYKDGETRDDEGITLRSFFALNGTNSSGGGGYLDQPWVLRSKPGQIGWDIPGRYKSP